MRKCKPNHTRTRKAQKAHPRVCLCACAKKSTDYGDCPYRCDPGGDWYAFPSAYLVQVPVDNGVVTELDPQCETVEVYDDAQGRAILSEKHAAYGLGQGDIPVGNGAQIRMARSRPNGRHLRRVHVRLRLQVAARRHRAGRPHGERHHDAVPSILLGRRRRRLLFRHRWVAPTRSATPTRPRCQSATSTFERIKAGKGGDSWLANNCGNANWWDGDVDHTSIYVHEQGRIRPDERFELYTHGGTCQWDAAWRYEGLEVYVLPYARFLGVDCNGITQSNNLNGGDALPGTLEECARACANYEGPDGTCHGFAAYIHGSGAHVCALKELASPYLEDVGGQCDALTSVDMYVYTGAPPPPPTGRRLEEQVASASTAEAVVADEGHRRLQTPAPPPSYHKVLDGCAVTGRRPRVTAPQQRRGVEAL